MIALDLNLRGIAILASGLVLLNWATALGPVPAAEREPADEPKTIHLAAGQIVCRPGDMEGNLRQIETLARQAAQAGARLCLFAEGAITGYVLTPDVLRQAPRADRGPVVERLRRLAAELKIVIAAGTLERSDQAYHVSCFIALPDGQVLVQRKHLLGPAGTSGRLPGGTRGADVLRSGRRPDGRRHLCRVGHPGPPQQAGGSRVPGHAVDHRGRRRTRAHLSPGGPAGSAASGRLRQADGRCLLGGCGRGRLHQPPHGPSGGQPVR